MTDDTPADAVFALLSDETRVDVLRAIAVAQDELERIESGPAELTFSEIYDRVDVDNTSRLSYHLGELAGTILRKREDGYSFTHAGERLARFVLAGNYGRPPADGPRETPGTCVFCGESPLEASLRGQFFTVSCPACDRPVTRYPVAPALATAWDGAELIRHVKAKQAADYAQILRGVCPACSGRLDATVRETADGPLPDADQFLVVDRCEACLRRYGVPMTYRTAYQPSSVAFHRDHGVDVLARGTWDFHEHVYAGRWRSDRATGDDADGTVAYVVELRLDDGRRTDVGGSHRTDVDAGRRFGVDARRSSVELLRLYLDGDAAVARTERVRRDGVADDDV